MFIVPNNEENDEDGSYRRNHSYWAESELNEFASKLSL